MKLNWRFSSTFFGFNVANFLNVTVLRNFSHPSSFTRADNECIFHPPPGTDLSNTCDDKSWCDAGSSWICINRTPRPTQRSAVFLRVYQRKTILAVEAFWRSPEDFCRKAAMLYHVVGNSAVERFLILIERLASFGASRRCSLHKREAFIL